MSIFLLFYESDDDCDNDADDADAAGITTLFLGIV